MSSLVDQIEFLTAKKRLSTAAVQMFETISTMTSVTEAVRQMAPFLKQPIYEREMPNENTWQPIGSWDGVLCLEDDGILWPPNSSPVLRKGGPLYNAILSTMKPWDMMVVGDIVVQHIPEHKACCRTMTPQVRLIKATSVLP